MQPSPLRIAIVGSGTAGPAAAIYLARAGHGVAPKKLPVGAGFMLQPTGMAVLHELGLADALLPLGWLRDLVFPVIQRIPPLRLQMTATMAGGKTGPFSSLSLKGR